MRTDLEKQHQEAAAECKSLQKEADLIQKDLMEIMLGRKTYPKELEEARREIQKGLYEQFGKTYPSASWRIFWISGMKNGETPSKAIWPGTSLP